MVSVCKALTEVIKLSLAFFYKWKRANLKHYCWNTYTIDKFSRDDTVQQTLLRLKDV